MRGDNKAKRVRQVDFYTGEFIDEYESISEAARDNFLKVDSLQKALKKNNGRMAYKELKFEII